MKNIIIASGPVIVKNQKVLLDKSGEDDFWKFCGGRVDDLGLSETAIKRAKEELGIDIFIKDPKPFLMHTKKPGDEKTDLLLVHYLADFSGEILPGKMVKEWKWFDVGELPTDLAPNISPAIKYFCSERKI